jgi:hypothetical protein
VRLHPGTTVWHGGQNYEWLKKYGIQQKFVSQETHPRIAEGLRAGLPLDIAGIRTDLATHLKDRTCAMENQLVFVEECLLSDLRAETPLKVIQFWHQHPIPLNASLAEVHAFVAPRRPDAFARRRTATDAFKAVEDKLEMFDRHVFALDDRRGIGTKLLLGKRPIC